MVVRLFEWLTSLSVVSVMSRIAEKKQINRNTFLKDRQINNNNKPTKADKVNNTITVVYYNCQLLTHSAVVQHWETPFLLQILLGHYTSIGTSTQFQPSSRAYDSKRSDLAHLKKVFRSSQ